MKYQFLSLITILYLVHLGIKFLQYPVNEWISSYLADVLCLPILLSYILLVLRYFKKKPLLWLNTPQILFLFLYVSILFEFILPKYSKRYTADIYDVLAYAFGAIFFYCFQKKICPIFYKID
jgi:hypothetical protein